MDFIALSAGLDPAVKAQSWVVGAVVFAIMMALLLGLLAFGKGRDHS